MTRTYSKYIPSTYRGILNSISNETQAPRWMVEELFNIDEVEAFIEEPEMHNECLDVWMNDIKIRIDLLQRIKDKLENWKE